VMRRAEFGRLAGEIEFDPVARRKKHRLSLRIAAAKARQRLGGLIAIESQPFADLDRRRVVAAADHLELHDRPSTIGPAPARGCACCEPPTRSMAITRARKRKLATVRYATLRPCWAGL